MASFDLRTQRERRHTGSSTAVAPDPEVLLSEDLERNYRSVQDPWSFEQARLRSFFHNAQFTEDQVRELAARGQAAVPINVIYPVTEQAVAMLTTNKPRFIATGREDSDRQTASVISDGLAYIWDQSRGNMHLKRATFDAYVRARGVMMAYVDPFADHGKGEIYVTSVDPFEVFPDPNSRDILWRDAAHIIVSRTLTAEQIERAWPDAARLLKGGAQTATIDTYGNNLSHSQAQMLGPVSSSLNTEEYRVIERYSKVKVDYKRTLDTTTGIELVHLPEEFREFVQQPAYIVGRVGDDGGMETQPVTDEEAVLQLDEMYAEAQPDPRMPEARVYIGPPQVDPETGQQIPGETLILHRMTYADMIDRQVIMVTDTLLDRVKLVISIGGRLYKKLVLPITEYPLVPISFRHAGNPYPMSDIGFVKPLQESLNKLHMQIVANLATGNNQKIIVPRGSIDRNQLERELARAGAAVLEVDYDLGEPKIVGPAPLPSGLFAYFETLIAMIEKELGIFASMAGDPNSAPPTFRGTLVLDDFGQRRIRSKADDIENALVQLGKVVVELMPKVYTEEKVFRITQPNNTVRESVANQLTYDDASGAIKKLNDISMATCDVVVVAGSTLPSNRWALSEYYENLYQLGAIDQVELLKKSELVDVEGVLERSGYISQLEGMIQQLQEEVKNLKGDLQTADREEMHAKKRLELNKFQMDLQGQSTQAKAAAELYRNRLADELAMTRRENKVAVREFKSANKSTPTNNR